MPARRLPWFKFWPEAMRHEKVAMLSDGLFRTWLAALAYGSEQPVRWRFASVKHAATVTGRPAKHITDLIAARLLDLSDSGEVWVHDWRQWQERYESDFAPKPTPEHSAKTPRTLRENSTNAPTALTRDTDTEEEGDTESEREPEPNVPDALKPLVSGGAGGEQHGAIAPPKAKRGGKKPRTGPPLDFDPNDTASAAGAELGMSPDEVDAKAEACMDHWRGKGEERPDWHATLRTWLRNAPKFDQLRPTPRGPGRPTTNATRPEIPRTTSELFQTRTGALQRR